MLILGNEVLVYFLFLTFLTTLTQIKMQNKSKIRNNQKLNCERIHTNGEHGQEKSIVPARSE